MKNTDLRIGNYVNVPIKEQCPFRIDAFEYCSEQFIKVAQEIEISGTQVHPLTWYGGDLEPIPLTEEWLLKFGFEKNFNNFYEKLINKDEDDFIGKLTDYFFAYYIDKKDNYPLIYIKYVHQLQNLYFALTGEELTIKE